LNIQEFLRTGCEDREYSLAELLFFLSFFAEKKFVIWGQNICFQIRLKKQTGHPSLLLLIFWQVKNVCALFREIE